MNVNAKTVGTVRERENYTSNIIESAVLFNSLAHTISLNKLIKIARLNL